MWWDTADFLLLDILHRVCCVFCSVAEFRRVNVLNSCVTLVGIVAGSGVVEVFTSEVLFFCSCCVVSAVIVACLFRCVHRMFVFNSV